MIFDLKTFINFYSTFGDASLMVGPVCCIGTVRSVSIGCCCFFCALTVKTPSDDKVDVTSLGFVSPVKQGIRGKVVI